MATEAVKTADDYQSAIVKAIAEAEAAGYHVYIAWRVSAAINDVTLHPASSLTPLERKG